MSCNNVWFAKKNLNCFILDITIHTLSIWNVINIAFDIDIELTSNTVSDIKKLEALRAEKQALLTDINGNPKGTYVYTAGITKNKKFLEKSYTYAAYRLGQIKKSDSSFDNLW